MITGLLELARLAGLAALLLSFAILAGRRIQPVAYPAQLAAIGVAALCQAALQRDWGLVLAVPILALQGAAVWFERPAPPGPAAFPVVTLCMALLLAVLAIASTPSEGMGMPLGIVLLGLLGTAAGPGPFGVLTVLNGVALAMIVAPGFPLRLVIMLVMAGLASIVVSDGARPAWVRR